MRLDLRGLGRKVDGEARDQMVRRLGFALDRFADRLGLVLVRLTDVNGPRGGVDQRCRIVVQMVPTGRLVVEDMAADPVTAVSRAARRLVRSVGRFRERKRGH